MCVSLYPDGAGVCWLVVTISGEFVEFDECSAIIVTDRNNTVAAFMQSVMHFVGFT